MTVEHYTAAFRAVEGEYPLSLTFVTAQEALEWAEERISKTSSPGDYTPVVYRHTKEEVKFPKPVLFDISTPEGLAELTRRQKDGSLPSSMLSEGEYDYDD